MEVSKNRDLLYNSLNLITNRAYVKSDECKSQYADAPVFINNVSDLSVTKTSNCDRFEVNRIITYIINVKNNGPSKASGVVLMDVLAPSVIFDSIVLSQGYFALEEGCIICYLGSINDGDGVTVTLNVIPQKNCPIINSVFVIGNEFDPNKENNVNFLELYNKKNLDCDIYKLIVILIVLYIIYKVMCCTCSKRCNLKYKNKTSIPK
jgi:uncharacterized repeat protein (TIGR01451 family)